AQFHSNQRVGRIEAEHLFEKRGGVDWRTASQEAAGGLCHFVEGILDAAGAAVEAAERMEAIGSSGVGSDRPAEAGDPGIYVALPCELVGVAKGLGSVG